MMSYMGTACVWVSPLQWQIIPLLTQAVSHLKSYGCERMITSLKVLLADEYYLVKDYEKSFVYVLKHVHGTPQTGSLCGLHGGSLIVAAMYII